MNKEGNSSINFILMFALIIMMVLLPIFIFLSERLAVVIVVDEFQNNVDQSFLAVYESLDVGQLSKRQVLVLRDNFQDEFEELLDKNLSLDENPILLGVGDLTYQVVEGSSNNSEDLTYVSFQAALKMRSLSGISHRDYVFYCKWQRVLPIDW